MSVAVSQQSQDNELHPSRHLKLWHVWQQVLSSRERKLLVWTVSIRRGGLRGFSRRSRQVISEHSVNLTAIEGFHQLE